MSISSMTISTAKNPTLRNFTYRDGLWDGNVSVADFHFETPAHMIQYLKSKYKRVYYFRVRLARTFGGKFVKPKELYKDDMDRNDAEPNLIMVSDGTRLKMVTTRAKRAKEFINFGSAANNIYVPVFIYKDSNSKIQFINFN